MMITIDLDQELKTAIKKASALYGAKVMGFKILPVTIGNENGPRSAVDEKNRTVSVTIGKSVQSNAEAQYRIWHEAVHCLSPVERSDVTYFEEGIATHFALKFCPSSKTREKALFEALGERWKVPLITFQKLRLTNQAVRALRNAAPGRYFDNIDAEMIKIAFGCSTDLAADLVKRVPKA